MTPRSLILEVRALVPLAAPLALAQAGLALMGLVDVAVVGRVSPAAQGAVGVANALFFFFALFGTGVMMALDPLISQAVGAGNPGRARSLLWQGAWLGGLITVLLLPLLLVSPALLEPLGVEPEVARGARTYLYWRLPHLPLMLGFTALRSWLQGVGRARPLFVGVVAANLVNLALDLVLVFGWGPIPALGVAGAALATVGSTLVQVAACLAAVGPAPEGTRRALDVGTLKEAVRLGLPIGLSMGAEVGIFAFAGVLAGVLGAREVAAHQIALTWSSLTFCFAVGIGQAAATRVGWAIGARDPQAARRAGLAAFLLGTGVMAVFASAFLLLRGPLAALGSDDAGVRALAATLFLVAAGYQLSDGLQAIGAGVLRGAADTRYALFANLVGHYGVGLPVAIVLGLSGGGSLLGLWWGLCAGLTVVAAALVGRFVLVSRASSWPRSAAPAAVTPHPS